MPADKAVRQATWTPRKANFSRGTVAGKKPAWRVPYVGRGTAACFRPPARAGGPGHGDRELQCYAANCGEMWSFPAQTGSSPRR